MSDTKDPWQQRWEDVMRCRESVSGGCVSVALTIGHVTFYAMDDDAVTCIREQLIGQAWEAEWEQEERAYYKNLLESKTQEGA